MTDDVSLAFAPLQLIDPAIADQPERLRALLKGTYRSNWSRLKVAAYGSTYSCIVNAANHLHPTAVRIVEHNSHPAERAFLLSFNQRRLLGGPALGAISLIAFAQESFVRLAYQVAVELRLQRNRALRSQGLDNAITASVAAFDGMSFMQRCHKLLAELRAPRPKGCLRRPGELMLFRNSIAHDAPLLYDETGQEQLVSRGASRVRATAFGAFDALESGPCPVRLKHIKAAIDSHDELVSYCFERTTNAKWAKEMVGFFDGTGRLLKDTFAVDRWYKLLSSLSQSWEKEFQSFTTAPLESEIEMRNALVNRARMRRS